MSFFKKINWQYAIGEVLIVILGISIAFALNNWASQHKTDTTKEKYLLGLLDDLDADVQQFEDNLKTLNRRIESCKLVRRYTYESNDRKDTLMNRLYELPTPIDFWPRNITFKTLVNSGDLKLIDNFDLRHAIQEHYLIYTTVQEIYERQNILTDKYVSGFFMNSLDYEAIYRDKNYSFLNDSFFKNMLGAQQTTFRSKIEATQNGLESCKKLIDQIKSRSSE